MDPKQVVFQVVLVLALSVFGFESTSHQQQQQQQQLDSSCKPFVKLANYVNMTSSGANSTSAPSSRSIGDISFGLGDIDMAVSPLNGSINSALRLLSSLGSQLDPLQSYGRRYGRMYDSDDVEAANLASDDEDDAQSEADEQGDDDDEEDHNDDDESMMVMQNVVRFKRNKIHISGLNMSMINVYLLNDQEPKFSIGIKIKNTTLVGKFLYNGALVVTDTPLRGFYRMSIENIHLMSSFNLTKQHITKSSSSSHVSSNNNNQCQLRSNDFRMNITDLGYIQIDIYDSERDFLTNSPDYTTSNLMLRVLQRVLQKTIKRTYYTFESYIRNTLEREGRRYLDCELSRFSPLLSPNDLNESSRTSSSSKSSNSNSNSKEPQQTFNRKDLAKIIGNEVRASKLARVALPDFEHNQTILGSQSSIKFSNGSLSGLDNIRLNEETRIKLQDKHLLLNSSLGWTDLSPRYNWSLSIAGSKSSVSKGFVQFNIKAIDFEAVISKGLEGHPRVSVGQLNIKRLDDPRMDIGGLPGMNRLTRGFVNFFMGRLKQRITGSIQPVLKQQLENSINKLAGL